MEGQHDTVATPAEPVKAPLAAGLEAVGSGVTGFASALGNAAMARHAGSPARAAAQPPPGPPRMGPGDRAIESALARCVAERGSVVDRLEASVVNKTPAPEPARGPVLQRKVQGIPCVKVTGNQVKL